MAATLSTAREEFIRQMYRDNVVVERPRLLAVLDAVIAWSTKHAEFVRFRPDDNTKGTIRFEEVGSETVFWAASPRRENVPVLELMPGSSRFLAEETRNEAIARLNAQTREANPTGRMHIGFGALKNPAGRAVVLGLMDELLDKMQSRRRTSVSASTSAVVS